MKVVVSAQGESLDAAASPVFGRCPAFVFVDTETFQAEAVANPAMGQSGGAGIQAAQFVVNRGAQAVLTGNLGPNAFDVLQAAGVPGYRAIEGTVRQVVEAFNAGKLEPMSGASVAEHAGMGRGHGMGRGMGRRAAAPPSPPQVNREAELAELRAKLQDLRQQLADVMARIEALEKEG